MTNDLLNTYNVASYITHQQGVITPSYFNGTNITYESDSEYFLFGYKVLIIPSLYEAISTLSNHRIEGDNITTLVKLLEPNTNYIINKQNHIIYNVNALPIKVSNPELVSYLEAIQKLDALNQPYPKGFLINPDGSIDEMLLKLVNNPDNLFYINQLVGQYFRDGDTDIYTRIGKSVCQIPSLELQINPDFSVIESNNSASISKILNCNQEYAIIGVGVNISPTQKHQVVVILNTTTGSGYLFDPSYQQDYGFTGMYRPIIRYLHRKLARKYPELNIKPINDFGCPYLYSFQANFNDLYCISWSFYMSILFLLNDQITFDQIVNYIYQIGKIGLRIVIPRFLIWAFGSEFTEIILEDSDED